MWKRVTMKCWNWDQGHSLLVTRMLTREVMKLTRGVKRLLDSGKNDWAQLTLVHAG